MTFAEHLVAAYGDETLKGAKVRPLESDRTGRRLEVVLPDDKKAIFTIRPVGGQNSGAFRGWVTLTSADWRRIRGPQAPGWTSYTVMVGFMPDEETVWWSAVYRDADLARLEPEEMDDGRWYRFTPEQAAPARLAVWDSQLAMFPDDDVDTVPPEPSPAEQRRVVYEGMLEDIEHLFRHDNLRHLTGAQAAYLLSKVHGILGEVIDWRRRQGGHAA